MKYSYNLLKKLSGTKKNPKQLAELLTMKSFEVESISEFGKELRNVVVGKIIELKKHPNADKLRVAKVLASEKLAEMKTIVCGANNIKIGDKVPVALPGTKLPGGEIKEVEIRGVRSHGMLCAEDELGAGKDHSGVMILSQKAKIGEKITKVLGFDDFVLEIKILSNRGHDALSHVGMAREICVLEGRKFSYDFKKIKKSNNKGKLLKVKIQGKDICPRYIGVLANVEIKESPEWMKLALEALGLNPINNVVDATNYVMMELGQPMHAFDFSKLKNETSSDVNIVVRSAKEKEKITLLDETVKELSGEDIVVANNERVLALAGIMGGKDSGVSEDTKKIVLESANFNPAQIRKTGIKFGIKTESELRFEKGIDPNLAESAMARMIEILSETSELEILEISDNYLSKLKPWKIKLNIEYVEKLLGEKISQKDISKILNLLEIKTKTRGKVLECEIPTFRLDLETQEDLIEEIGRIYGYENIRSQIPMVPLQSPKISNPNKFERLVKDILVGNGFSELYNYSFYSKMDAGLSDMTGIKHLELANPMNPDQDLLRTSLIPNILKNIRDNINEFEKMAVFEAGKVYWPNGGVLPEEKTMLIGATTTRKRSKKEKERENAKSFYEIKGQVSSLLKRVGIANFYYDDFEAVPRRTPISLWHGGRFAEIKIEESGESFGCVGEINPIILVNFGIHERVAMFEFEMDKLLEISREELEFVPLQKYPISIRDISMVSDDADVRVDDILRTIQKSGGEIVLDVDLFDIFDFEDGTTSYAFHIIFGSNKKTLEGAEIDDFMKKIRENLEREWKMKVRE